LAKAAFTEKNQYKATTGKEKAIDPYVVVPKKARLKQKHWYNIKIKLWQAILMSVVAVWLFWIFWVVGYVGGKLRVA